MGRGKAGRKRQKERPLERICGHERTGVHKEKVGLGIHRMGSGRGKRGVESHGYRGN